MLRSNPNKPCKECDGIGHSAFNCPYKARPYLVNKTPLKQKKPMKKIGKVGRELVKLSKEYHEEHPGMQLCFYCLYSGWENWLEKWNAEHTKSKAHHPGLRFNTSIWVISCGWHNEDKGSKDIDEYLDILDERKKAHESGLSEI